MRRKLFSLSFKLNLPECRNKTFEEERNITQTKQFISISFLNFLNKIYYQKVAIGQETQKDVQALYFRAFEHIWSPPLPNI